MEKFSNSASSLWDQVKYELLNHSREEGWRDVVFYREVGQLRTHGFSITIMRSIKGECKLRVKKWNAEYDNERFKLGIYNLDRLAVRGKDIVLPHEEYSRIEKLIQQDLQTFDVNGIVLDGLLCEMVAFEAHKKLTWNAEGEMSKALQELVNDLEQKANII